MRIDAHSRSYFAIHMVSVLVFLPFYIIYKLTWLITSVVSSTERRIPIWEARSRAPTRGIIPYISFHSVLKTPTDLLFSSSIPSILSPTRKRTARGLGGGPVRWLTPPILLLIGFLNRCDSRKPANSNLAGDSNEPPRVCNCEIENGGDYSLC